MLGRNFGEIRWLVAPGMAMIALTYGLARFAYGLVLPELREAFDLPSSVLGVIGSGSYVGYCVAAIFSLVYTSRTGPRFMAVAAGAVAVAGLAIVATAPSAWVLAAGVILAGSSTGLSSPPMVEAVASSIRGGLQDRANTLINCGTSVGIAASGTAALVLMGQWRVMLAAFAAVGVAVLLWNAAFVPRKPAREIEGDAAYRGTETPRLTFSYLMGSRSAPLFAAAILLGVSSAAYWTFSRDLVSSLGGLSESGSTLFWIVIGVSGLLGGAAGDMVRRLGLKMALRISLLSMAASIALLATAPGVTAFTYLSAATFGPAYIMLTGIILVWSVAVFHDRPSAGTGVGFLLIAIGQIVGSTVMGTIAGATSLTTAFYASAAISLAAAFLKPHPKDTITGGDHP
ncbi:MFS transporter [soil metagenome]